jgi:hypothetical protein
MVPRGRIRDASGSLVLLLLGIGAALGLAELVVREVAPQKRPLSIALRGLYVSDATLGYRMAPGFERRVRIAEFTSVVRTNSLGLRDHELGPRRPGTLRLLGLGDSFTFGVHAGPLEKCYLKQLGKSLDARLARQPFEAPGGRERRSVEIVNAGIDGYGTVQEIGLLQDLEHAVQPDGVLLGFYLGNDFTDNSGRTRMTVVDGYQMLEDSAEPFRREFAPMQRRARLFLNTRSELYLLLKRRLLHPEDAAVSRAPGAAALAHGASPLGQEPKSFEYYRYDSGFADCMRSELTPTMRIAMQETRRAFEQLRGWCDAHGTRALVVAIPAQEQVDPAERRRWLDRFGLREDEFDFSLPNRRLAELAQSCGLEVFDLTPGFAARVARGDTLFMRTDTHWNAAGHAAAAELLTEPVLQHLVSHIP